MEEIWDLIVVGAGPAGAAAALEARRLAPGGIEVSGVPARPSWVVPRRVLDERLVRAAVRAGAVLERERVRSLEQRDGLVVVNGALAARVAVGADGANSAVRRLLGAPASPDRQTAIALRGYAPSPPGPPEQLISWVTAGWPAYAWSFATGTGLANVGYGLLRTHLEGGRAELERRLRALLPGADPVPGSLRAHHLPFSSHRPLPGSDRVLLCGDAASMINPLSGEGIYYALLSC